MKIFKLFSQQLKFNNNRILLIPLILILLCLFININADQCLYKSDNSGYLNTQHQLYSAGFCFPCLQQCKSCINVTDKSCSSGNCQKYYYYNTSLLSCQPCSSMCQQCSGSLPQQCKICIQGYYFDEYYKKCKICPFGASTCSNLISYSCLSGFYFDSQGYMCRKCALNCQTCQTLPQCLECKTGYFLVSTNGNLCKACQTLNCQKCINQTTCYECKDGYYVSNDGSQCLSYNCVDKNCIQCSSNLSICQLCIEGYFLFESKCYYGSSLLCLNGYKGSSYGKCNSCRNQITYTKSSTPSFCLLEKSKNQMLNYDFKILNNIVLCSIPEYMTTIALKKHTIQLIIQPLYQIDYQIKLISKLSNDLLLITMTDNSSLGTYTNLYSSSNRTSKSFYCKTKSSISIDSSFLIHRIKQSYFIQSVSSLIYLKIQSLNLTQDIYLSQILIKKYLCLIQNCKACYSAQLCSVCNNGYFLEEYQCKLQCSQGYYTNKVLKVCVYQCQSGFYLNFQTSQCIPCPGECKTCNSLGFCTSCSSGYFLSSINSTSFQCLNYCPDNKTYAEAFTNTCEKCTNPCKSCFSIPTNCTSCLKGYLHSNSTNISTFNKCVTQCPVGYYQNFNTITPICSVCSLNCKHCTINSNFCTLCEQKKVLSDGKCNDQCEQGKYQEKLMNNLTNNTERYCQSCSNTCQGCLNRKDNCTKCSMGFLFSINKNNLSIIYNTIQTIQIKYLFEILNSTSTEPFGICVGQCPLFYYFPQTTLKMCISCPQSCLQCESSLKCKKCKSDYFMEIVQSSTLCVEKCNSLFLFMDKNDNMCKKCKWPCFQCNTDYDGKKCVSCINGYYIFKSITGNESIINTTTNNTNSLEIVQCLLLCPSGYYKYKNLTSQVLNSTKVYSCQRCPSQCSQCLSYQICIKCKSSYILTELNKCQNKTQCSDGYYLFVNLSAQLNSTVSTNGQNVFCQSCHSSCKQCTNLKYNCTFCQKNKYLSIINSTLTNNISTMNGQCLDQCKNGYFHLIYYILKSNRSVKISQNQYKSLIQSSTINSTTQSLYIQYNTCSQCSLNCTSCSNLTFCSSCKSQFYLSATSQCSSNCTIGYYPTISQQIGGICKQCIENCANCISQIVCIQCTQNYSLIQGSCMNKCNDGYFMLSTIQNITNTTKNRCEKCSQQCQICTAINKCQSCKIGYFLFSLLNQSLCQANCVDGYYKNVYTKQCQICKSPCKNCLNQYVCLTCESGYLLVNQRCATQCPQNFYLNFESNISNIQSAKCSACPTRCNTCISSSNCSSCVSGYFYHSQTSSCLITCPDTFYSSSISKKCQKCQIPCVKCENKRYQCLSCIQGYYFRNKVCLQICPRGTYISQTNISNLNQSNLIMKTCSDCPLQCKLCQNLTYCQECKPKKYLFINVSNYPETASCLSSCPNSTYLDITKNTCYKCSQNCQQCTQNKYTCTKCKKSSKNKFLLRSICVQQCPNYYFQYLSLNTNDKNNYKCLQCSKWCEKCQNANICTKCGSGYLFVNSTKVQDMAKLNIPIQNTAVCMSACPDNFYGQKQSLLCLACPQGCLTCKNQLVCLSCNLTASFVLYFTDCIKFPCPQNLYYMVQSNECVQKCPFLIYPKQRQCYKQKCPKQLIRSTDGKYCLDKCQNNQIVGVNKTISDQNNIIICKDKSTYLGSNYQEYEMPQFTFNIIPTNGQIIISLIYSFDAVNGLTLDQASKKINIKLFNVTQIGLLQGSLGGKKVESVNSNNNKGMANNKKMIKYKSVSSSISSQQSSTFELDLNIQTYKISSNSIFFKAKIPIVSSSQTQSQTQKFFSNFSLPIKIIASLNNPYNDFTSQINNKLVPLQNYKQSKIFTYLNYNQTQKHIGGLIGIIWLVLILVLVIIIVKILVNKRILTLKIQNQIPTNQTQIKVKLNQQNTQKNVNPIIKVQSNQLRLYLFSSLFEYFHLLFLLSFLPISLPIILQSLFYQFKYISGQILIPKIFQYQLSSLKQTIISPWQYYKFSNDIHFYKNTGDVIILFGIVLLIVFVSKLILKINKKLAKNAMNNQSKIKAVCIKIVKNKKYIMQLIGNLFLPLIGIYSLINIFFKTNQNQKYLSQTQNSIGYKFFVYIFSIIYFISPFYVFYYQFENKLSFDLGLNEQKKNIGICIPLYKYLRQYLFIFFLTYYHNNPIYCICIHLMSTALIWMIILWYQPYINKLRQIAVSIQEGSLFILLIQLLMFVVNPDYANWLGYIIVIHALIQILLYLTYPTYCLYQLYFHGNNIQEIKKNNQQQIQHQSNQTQVTANYQQKQSKNNDTQENQIKKQNKNNNNKGKTNRLSLQIDNNMFKLAKNQPQNNINQQQSQNSALQADQSQQGQILRKKNLNNVIRLAKKQTNRIKQFKNYTFSQQDDDSSSQSEQKNQGNKREQEHNNKANKNKNNNQVSFNISKNSSKKY